MAKVIKSEVLESNLYDSFNRVKSDVMRLNSEINKIGADMQSLRDELKEFMQSNEGYDFSKIVSLKEGQAKITEKMFEFSQRLRAIEAAASNLEMKNIATNQKIEKVKKTAKKTAKRPVKKIQKVKVIKKVVKKATKFVASKTGKKFHVENCIFAKNIKPKSKKIFKSKTAALNQGFKPCHCVLK